MLAKELLERSGGLGGIVVRNLAADVVRDVVFANRVHKVRTDGTEHLPVDSAQSATLEVPLLAVVVREHRIGVLKVRDHDEPVVDHQVRNKVVLGNSRDATSVVTEKSEETAHGKEAGVGDEDLLTVTSVENERVGVEVCDNQIVSKPTRSRQPYKSRQQELILTVGSLRVPVLARSVGKEVRRPAEELKRIWRQFRARRTISQLDAPAER